MVDHPSPEPDRDDAAWWEAIGEGRLTVAWCKGCDRSWLRPTPSCPRCGSTAWDLREIAPCGRLYSWVTVNRALDPAFRGDEPYTVGVVELEGGARLNVRLLYQEDAPQAEDEVAIALNPPGVSPFAVGVIERTAS